MNQKKVGRFLKELRSKKGITQEQLAEFMNVSNRTVSRWETGSNMPDLDVLIELADYYEVEIRELLDGERKNETMNETEKDTLLKVADYSNKEKARFTRRIHILFLAAIAFFILYAALETVGLADDGITEDIASFALGFVLGMLLVGALFTSRYAAKIRTAKQRFLNRYKKESKRK